MSAKYGETGQARGAGRANHTTFPFVPPPELQTGETLHCPVVIVGGGLIGLATAIDLDRRGFSAIVLEKHDSVSDGSRAICWSKRTLEILDRLGTGERMLEKGVTWNVGKVYHGDQSEPIYTFDLLADKAQKFPAFINLQQYYAEEYLIELLADHPGIDLRWQSEVTAVENDRDKVIITVTTPEGNYPLSCDYLIAADGHRSPVRTMLGLDFEGRVFEDNFLIADVRMKAGFPAERRFWFDPVFNPGKTALLHKQADDVWRIDFQLGWDIDKKAELDQKNVDARIRAFIGDDIEFDYEWVSLYTFQCRRMKNFVHNRVIFAGDSAHLVSPFGARGANGGLQDVDNLVWKLALILENKAPASLLDSYDVERVYGADENILNSSRSTDFLTPKSNVSRAFRDAALELARDFSFARLFVNSGRLSVPCTLDQSTLNEPDAENFSAKQRPGSPCLDAPVTRHGSTAWFLNQLGDHFTGILFTDATGSITSEMRDLHDQEIPVHTLLVKPKGSTAANGEIIDHQALLQSHYDARPGTYYLIRPDQHVVGRWRRFDLARVRKTLSRATGHSA